MRKLLIMSLIASLAWGEELIPIPDMPMIVVPLADRPNPQLIVETAAPIVPEADPVAPKVIPVVRPDLNDQIARRQELAEIIQDHRALDHDSSIIPDNNWLYQWEEIYRRYAEYPLEFKPYQGKLYALSEIWTPKYQKQWDTLVANLTFYQPYFNAVLVCFDGTEDLSAFSDLVNLLQQYRYRVICAYSGPEHLEATIFRDPQAIKDRFRLIAPKSVAMLIGWRRTSTHLFVQDRAFTNYLVACARTYAPDLPVIGELYYGPTGLTNEQVQINRVRPDYAAGILVTGIIRPNFAGINASVLADEPGSKWIAVSHRPYSGDEITSMSALMRRLNLAGQARKAGFDVVIICTGDGTLPHDNLSTNQHP